LQHVGAGRPAGGETTLRDIELHLLRARNIFRGRDLRPQRSLVDDRRHDIGSEGEIACLECELLVFGLGLLCFHLPPRASECVERIRHTHRSGLEIVEIRTWEAGNTE
jgi:hypothetical protein